mmetsp:Transcript_4194/g.7004  ORF Transcript_4194/g.7004 Transcript_4194/m.7004 type:complete len:655 (-) Transcript_4194:39-2003(-)|eukprot:CAMPEP_0119024572 /NCGR_PEP_ID=MMETSP1176-20130426/32132_1 /TAXON_ID=265551 /ORGANISM="Synedropsis recta cf, Strain CCMP1620" /LENGTH=654 /DNA_ID=CAMNT_0006979905 /DNA_START=78 /DNA_END=2042 /DNA_ORIENTATION=+
MTLSFVNVKKKRVGYRRATSNNNNLNGSAGGEEAAPRYLLLVAILLAFLGGFVLGKQESTPTTVSAVWSRLAEAIGRDPEFSVDHLLGELTKTRLQLEETFRVEYGGDYYGRLYDQIQIQNHIFLASPMSRDRLKRRLMMKIVQTLIDPSKEVSFVWATAGDSSAAGHGNMLNQSYTAVLERTVQPAFQALGLQFVARNYAMSWYQSAPELALCMESVYGTDLDVLNWDFSMQDGQTHSYKTELWAERATMHPSLPLLFFVDNSAASSRLSMLQNKLESNGVGFVFVDKMAMDRVRSRVPPTVATSTAIVPEALQNWICPGGAVEGALPCDDAMRYFVCDQFETGQECLAAKYKTLTGCDAGQKSNHPGWKEHQFKGMLLGHYFLDVLEEALIALDAMKHPNGQVAAIRSQVILDRLEKMHQRDVRNATQAPIPVTYDGVDEELMSRITPSLLFRGNGVCHTALLPAQSRFLGHTTQSSLIGSSEGGYDTGMNKVLCHPVHNQLPLAYESSDRMRCPSAKIDHRDFFYLRNQDGWLHKTVPNHAELQAYQRSPAQGIIIICLQICPMDKCSDDYVGFAQVSSQHGHAKVDIKVDGSEVKELLTLDHRCHVLKGEDGIRWGPGKAGDGQYKLSFKLHVKMKGLDYSVKMSSIIVL